MAEFEGLDPNSERDEIRDIISALSQGNAGEEKLEKDISSISSLCSSVCWCASSADWACTSWPRCTASTAKPLAWSCSR